MDTTSTRTPHGGAPPRRSPTATLVPLAVLLLTVALIGWTAWPVVRPVAAVTVTQAVFDPSSAAPSAPVQAEQPPGPSVTVQAPGWLEAEPFYTACTALADGVIERIEVLEGDRVEKGQVVARMVAEDSQLGLRSASAGLSAAIAQLALAEADLAAAQTDWDQPVERERAVDVGRARVAESEAELAQLPALIAEADALLKRHAEELERAEQSLARDAINELEVITIRAVVAAQRARVDALTAREPLLKARLDRERAGLRAAERELDLRVEDRRRLDTARAAVALAESRANNAKAAKDTAALELERMTIRAPIAGYVQRRLKAPGDKVMRMMDTPHSAHILHLYDPSRLQVRVDVPLADAANIAVGQRCEVVVEVLPDTVFEGEVLRITHEADLQKNTLQAKVAVRNPSPLLRPEMLTRVKFLPANTDASGNLGAGVSRSPSVLAPIDTIDDRQGATRVWTVTDRRGDRGVLRAVPVTLGDQADGWVSVRGDLNAGVLLVSAPASLRPGQTVRIRSDQSEDRR